MSRPGHLSNRMLMHALAAGGACIVAWALALPMLPESMQTPGSPLLQAIGAMGTAFLLVPVAFALAKRTGRARSAAAWFSAHAVAAIIGTVLILVHTAGQLDEAPALLLLVLVALTVLGIWARVRGATRMADTFGTKPAAFRAPPPGVRDKLAGLLREKRDLLSSLDPDADEARFSPTLRHWLRSPVLTSRYDRLVRQEARLLSQRESVGAAQAWWRPLHLLLAAAFVAGVAVHVIVTLFFAGWVADGSEITWWHITAW